MALDHYISQVHLRRFYSPALISLMYAIRKSDLKRFTPKSESVCRIEEGNTNPFLIEPRAIEEFLKTVEGKYNAAVAALEAGKPDQKTIYTIAGFVSYVMSCSPTAMRMNSAVLEREVNTTAKIVDAKGVLPPPPSALGGKNLTELLDAGKVSFVVDPKYPQAVGTANILRRVANFGNFHWEILINEHEDCPFFSSDYPVAAEETRDLRILNRIIPLAPHIGVRICPAFKPPSELESLDFPNFSFQRRKISRSDAVQINRLLVRSAEDTVFFRDDQPWIARFVERNRHFRMETITVEVPHGNRGIFQLSRQLIASFQRGVSSALHG